MRSSGSCRSGHGGLSYMKTVALRRCSASVKSLGTRTAPIVDDQQRVLAHVGVVRGWRRERHDCTGVGSRSLSEWGRRPGETAAGWGTPWSAGQRVRDGRDTRWNVQRHRPTDPPGFFSARCFRWRRRHCDSSLTRGSRPSTDGTPRCRRLPIAGGAAELSTALLGEGVGRGLASSARDWKHLARFGPATDCSLRRASPSTSVSAWTSAITPEVPRIYLLGPHGPTTPCGGGVGIGSPHWPDAMSCPRGMGRPSRDSATRKWGRRNTPQHSNK